ncbi:CybS [Ostertagia ostertagi]
MSITLRHVVRAQRALLAARQMPRLCTPVSTTAVRALPSTLDDGANKTHDHSLHFKLSDAISASRIAHWCHCFLLPTSFMVLLWTQCLPLRSPSTGVQGVVNDYARPFVIGDTLAKTARACVYLITAALLAGLLHFNTNDVGLTEAFRMVFEL